MREQFDAWAADGRDRGMEERHWHTARHVLARMPVEPGDSVVDLGCGSGYALRALREAKGAGRGYGLDGSSEMRRNARAYTDDPAIGFVRDDFDSLPFGDGRIDHVFSMEAFDYAPDPATTLSEVARILRPGGTFFCAVNYYEENHYSHAWQEGMCIEMTRWSREQYREAFRDAGLHVAEQDNVPDDEVEIHPSESFPFDGFETREELVEPHRELGTLLTVGVAP